MDRFLAMYLVTYYPEFLTEDERMARSILVGTMKATQGRSDPEAQAEVGRGWLEPVEPNRVATVRELTAKGYEEFLLRAGERILRDHSSEVFVNRCRQCGGVARTPKARQCPHCHYSWHHLPRHEGGTERRS